MYSTAGSPNSIPVNLYFKCINLRNKDNFSKSDPYVVLFLLSNGQRSEVGRTESIGNNLNPNFQKGVPIGYVFQEEQHLVIKVVDDDSSNDDDIGQATCRLSDIISSTQLLNLSLVSSKTNAPSGTVQIRYERAVMTKVSYYFSLSCSKVKDIEWFSKSDPMIRIFRPGSPLSLEMSPHSIPEYDWLMAYETEFVKDNLNPIFRPFEINSGSLCYGNPNIPLKFEIWDYSKRGEHKMLGKAFTTVAKMKGGERTLDTADAGGGFTGSINIVNIREDPVFDFLDYLRNGLQLNLSIAIDFTGSNGSPTNSTSLHFIKRGSPNQYQTAIEKVGRIIVAYDADKKIPAFGFGAKVNSKYSDCFAVNFNEANPYVNSWEGALLAYSNCVPNVELYGPTNFAPVIARARQQAQLTSKQNPLIYHVLMILTDGEISDMAHTKNEARQCMSLPVSILIIGVGNSNFGNMRVLDDDTPAGNGFKRDIVQFVKFQDYANNHLKLTEEVLKELPTQIHQYYKSIGMVPKI